MNTVFSIDVEEWFHILETDSVSKTIADWDNYPSRINESMELLFDVLDRHNVKATLFFLGWVGEKYPHIVKEAQKRGHEIASHGCYHDLVYELGYKKFKEDIGRSKKILEDISGVEVKGYRAPGFSLTPAASWAYPALIEEGFTYSSSIYPAKRAHGFFTEFGDDPREIVFGGKSVLEFPMTVLGAPLTSLSCFGGGYFRLFPVTWFKAAAEMVKKKNRNLIFYIHPRDIDPEQPRLDMPMSRMFKSYINVGSALSKIDKILDGENYTCFEDVIAHTDVSSLPKALVRTDKGMNQTYLSFEKKEAGATRDLRSPQRPIRVAATK
ncbi:MAG: polysaccharide deacetylase family protein [Flavobacteriales bacterium]|nr:polysaccharide deacetylase family protein [Flavobacteriales bacterium]